MAVQPPRTDAAQASLRLYDRALHPELFHVRDSVSYEFQTGVFRAAVTESGHLLFLRRGDVIVTEVVGSHSAIGLPDRGIAAQTKACSGRDVHWSGVGLAYAASCHVDTVDNEVFERIDRELVLDARQTHLFCQLPQSSRLDPSPVSSVRIEPLDGAVSIHAVHTFPGENAIVRSQSLFEIF